MKLTKNFSLSEFACQDGTPVPVRYIENARELAKNLQVLRDYFGEPVFVSSGYRTPTWNKKVGGAKNSQHKKAKAGDITMKKRSPEEIQNTIELLIRRGKMKNGGLGKYKGFTHYDTRDVPARW